MYHSTGQMSEKTIIWGSNIVDVAPTACMNCVWHKHSSCLQSGITQSPIADTGNEPGLAKSYQKIVDKYISLVNRP